MIRDFKIEAWQVKGSDDDAYIEFKKELNAYLKKYPKYQKLVDFAPENYIDKILDFNLKEWVAGLSDPTNSITYSEK